MITGSDDEFMMLDQSSAFWPNITGEKNLLITPNAEHSLASGIWLVISSLGTFVRSIASGHQ